MEKVVVKMAWMGHATGPSGCARRNAERKWGKNEDGAPLAYVGISMKVHTGHHRHKNKLTNINHRSVHTCRVPKAASREGKVLPRLVVFLSAPQEYMESYPLVYHSLSSTHNVYEVAKEDSGCCCYLCCCIDAAY